MIEAQNVVNNKYANLSIYTYFVKNKSIIFFRDATIKRNP
jgi:hypothetical protein